MRKLLLSIVLMAACLTLAAQDDVEYIKNLVANNKVSFNYSLSVKGSAPIKLTGKAVIDGDCYSMRGNGIEMFCDGTTKWTLDREAKELYIESSEGTRDFLSDPTMWIDNVNDLKYSETSASGSFRDETQDVTFVFKFTSITSSPLSGSTEGFVFDPGSLGSDWIVTDLR